MFWVDVVMPSLNAEWAHPQDRTSRVSDCKWKVKSTVRQHASRSCWPGEEKAPGGHAVWGGSFIITCYQVSSIEPNELQDYKGNSSLLFEGVSAWDPCRSPHPPALPVACPGHKHKQCPPLALLSITTYVSLSIYFYLSSYLALVLLSLSWCLMPHPSLTVGCSATSG